MSKPNADQTGSNVVPLGAAISNLCSIVTFASASGIPVEEVTEWGRERHATQRHLLGLPHGERGQAAGGPAERQGELRRGGLQP